MRNLSTCWSENKVKIPMWDADRQTNQNPNPNRRNIIVIIINIVEADASVFGQPMAGPSRPDGEKSVYSGARKEMIDWPYPRTRDRDIAVTAIANGQPSNRSTSIPGHGEITWNWWRQSIGYQLVELKSFAEPKKYKYNFEWTCISCTIIYTHPQKERKKK